MAKKDLHKELELLEKKGARLRKLKIKKGKPIYRFGQIRNQCWNCEQYPRELNPKGDKGYYKCEFCGAWMHQ